MKFFGKHENSTIVRSGWSYDKKSDRPKIRKVLLDEQSHFCAYSEKVLAPTASQHIEHYDPGLKSTPEDGYNNWYLVLGWINERKPKKLDERFLPIIEQPHSEDLATRIRYREGLFEPIDPKDLSAKNFLAFIGVNHPDLVQEREAHVERIVDAFSNSYNGNFDAFRAVLLNDKKQLSFITALETAIGVELMATAQEAAYP